MIAIRPNPIPCSEESVRLFEQEIGAKLPADYREFLLATNGGWPERGNQIEVPGFPQAGGVTTFLALGVVDKEIPAKLAPHPLEGEETIDLVYMDLAWVRDVCAGRLPPGLLPIAHEVCGDAICLSVRPDQYGAVFYWDHESGPQPALSSEAVGLYKVADSFSEFLAMLRDYEGEP